jgi:hypothetical protein
VLSSANDHGTSAAALGVAAHECVVPGIDNISLNLDTVLKTTVAILKTERRHISRR